MLLVSEGRQSPEWDRVIPAVAMLNQITELLVAVFSGEQPEERFDPMSIHPYSRDRDSNDVSPEQQALAEQAADRLGMIMCLPGSAREKIAAVDAMAKQTKSE